MRFRSHISALLLVAAAVPAGAQDSAAPLDSVFRAFDRPTTPGCAVAVARRDRPVQERAYGMADLEHDVPNTPGTIFEAGSVSKQITAGAVVLLALDGKLAFDDDVRRYLPELPEYGAPITIRQLLNHTSGLRDWGAVAAMGGWPRGTRTYTNDLVLEIARRQRSLNYAPGTFFSYTNTGYNLLALIVGRVAGMSLAEFTRARIFEPLGMAHTAWRDDYARVVKGRALAYDPAAAGTFRLDMPFENAYGNGGLLTTPADLLRWTANLETGTVGGARFLAEMHGQGRLTSGRTIEYARGLYVTHYRGVAEVSHSGATAGYRAFLGRYPVQGVAVAVLCNASQANATALAHQVADAYLGSAAPTTSTGAAPPVRIALARLEALAGAYRSTRDGAPLRLVVRDGRLHVDGGAALGAVDDVRFQEGPTPGATPSSTVLFDAAPSPDGRPAFRILRSDGDTLRYERFALVAPTPAQLAEYVGTYRSDEADGTLVVSVDRGALRVVDAYGRVLGSLPPTWADAFGDEGLGVRFIRDSTRRVVALGMRASRAWDVRFARQP